VVSEEWGGGLVGSWDSAGWIGLPQRAGAKIARLIGASPDEVVCADSTSVNLFKLLSVALRIAGPRSVILSERDNFPTDLYIAQGLIEQLRGGHRLELVAGGDPQALYAAIRRVGGELAVVMLTQVDYRTGHLHDLAELTRRTHDAGALAVWDLAHSAGALPVDLSAAHADFAVGCGYKYFNGGPGAPAFLYVARRHQDRFVQPLSGWMGHAAPFEFSREYRPAQGIGRFLSGTPAVLAMSSLDAALDVLLEAPMAAIREKSLALGDLFIARSEIEGAGRGLDLVTPRGHARRGSHVSFAHPDGDAVMQALIARGVIGDFRPPDLLRFGLTPLYTRYTDAWDAAAILGEVLRDLGTQP
jgi:kynureninase